uniref:Uncharacterized protein n=1 Tax=Nymphaea colorata TaxID=210225 RepID=A0A5K0ZSN2_9MAGN
MPFTATNPTGINKWASSRARTRDIGPALR